MAIDEKIYKSVIAHLPAAAQYIHDKYGDENVDVITGANTVIEYIHKQLPDMNRGVIVESLLYDAMGRVLTSMENAGAILDLMMTEAANNNTAETIVERLIHIAGGSYKERT